MSYVGVMGGIVMQNAGVLDDQHHAPLIADIERWANAANIPVSMVTTSAVEFCGERELVWLKGIKSRMRSDRPNLFISGTDNVDLPVFNRMSAMAGVLLRNYIGANVCPLSDLLRGITTHNPANTTVLMVPDFFVKGTRGALQPYQLNGLYAYLLKRAQKNTSTIFYASDTEALRKDYGDQIYNLILSTSSELSI